VATNRVELDRLRGLEERTTANGIQFERIDQAELRRREPRIVGLQRSPRTVAKSGLANAWFR